MKSLSRAYFFYPLLLFCASVDICGNMSLGNPVIYSALCLYSIALSFRTSAIRFFALLAILAMESFFFYGQLSIQLVYLIPIALIARRTWSTFTHPLYHALLIVSVSLMAQLIIDSLVGIASLSMFTIIKFIINIVLTISLSLTYE